ncbi:hypothetical protein T09_5155 [Trichinella sp. T9]|nr:hypothetical protein T09_5155 [Trichinella sp. T9]
MVGTDAMPKGSLCILYKPRRVFKRNFPPASSGKTSLIVGKGYTHQTLWMDSLLCCFVIATQLNFTMSFYHWYYG